jgi:Lrp/AsnC family leucine-responsive transcriptional regulator
MSIEPTKGHAVIDETDRALLRQLQADATQSYATLGQAVGLSAGATHERVRKLRERGVIRRTTIDVAPEAVGAPVLAFVTLEAGAWMGDTGTAQALRDIPEVEEAHIIAGAGSVLLKVRAATTTRLQAVLRLLFAVEGVSATNTTVVLETVFERPIAVMAQPDKVGDHDSTGAVRPRRHPGGS